MNDYVVSEPFEHWVVRRFPGVPAAIDECHPAKKALDALQTRECLIATRESTGSGPRPVDLTIVATLPAPPRDWIVDHWALAGTSTLIASHGGLGKSLLSAQLSVCVASGAHFLGLPVRRSRVYMLSTEDDRDELHRRLRAVAAHVGVDLIALQDEGWLTVDEAVGEDVPLFARWGDKLADGRVVMSSEPVATPWLQWVEQRMAEVGATVLVADSASDLFDGDEVKRRDVRRFVRLLTGLVASLRGAVFLVGHVDKLTAKTGRGSQFYSGSTAWHNSVRQRWALYRETGVDDEDGTPAEDDGRRVLELQKTNYGRPGARIELRYDPERHVLAGLANATTAGNVVDSIAAHNEQRAILRAIMGCADADAYVPAAMQGQRTAYLVLSQRPEFPDALRGGSTTKKRRFAAHLEALRQIRHIAEGSYRRSNRHIVVTLEPTTEGRAECANI